MSSTTSLGRPYDRVRFQRGEKARSGSRMPESDRRARLSRADAQPPGASRTTSEATAVQIPTETDPGLYLRFGKRFLDLSLGGLASILLFPLFLVAAIAIKLDTPGPVFYRSTRVGKGGKPFTFYKLRSMISDAEQRRHEIDHLNEVSGPVFKVARDPRITQVGRILRRSSVDELPQLFHVLKGEMSLVGPRPPIPEEVAQYEPWQLRRLSVRPGITCIWQISGRSRLGFDEWMRLDMEYIDRRSFRLDLLILVKTIPAVFSGEGAY